MNDTAHAGLGVRIAAALIDALVVSVILVGATALTFTAAFAANHRGVLALIVSLGGAAAAAYLLPEAFRGRTLGKRLLRLRIVARDGARTGRAALLARWAVKCSPLFVATAVVCSELAADRYPLTDAVTPLVSAIERLLERAGARSWVFQSVAWMPIVYGGGIPVAAVLFAGCLTALGPRRQALHDRLTSTAVFPDTGVESQGFEPLPPANPA
jgi:uncharacterized RDD family membrane protein YckC